VKHGLSLGPAFFKGHGHGNDYLVFEEGVGWIVSKGAIQVICHAHRGIGGDGIVALLSSPPHGGPTEGSPPLRSGSSFRLRMFNPDGSEFERSGNGLRILGAYLHAKGRVRPGHPFPVEVGGGVVQMEVLGKEPGGVVDVAVEMGTARFGIDVVGGDPDSFGPGPTLFGPGGESLKVCLVSIGNPHCVLFREELLEEELEVLGPFLSTNDAFLSGTNVQLARVTGDREVEILIWERGVGRTSSSGTSACAVASAGVHEGHLHRGRITVKMEGGSFAVTVSPESNVRLEGPVQPLFSGELSKEMLEGLAAGSGMGGR